MSLADGRGAESRSPCFIVAARVSLSLQLLIFSNSVVEEEVDSRLGSAKFPSYRAALSVELLLFRNCRFRVWGRNPPGTRL